MRTISKSDIPLTVSWQVDCNVCGAGVETDEKLHTRQEAEDARDRHIQEHEVNEEWLRISQSGE